MSYAGVKHKVTMQVPRGNTNAVKDCFSTSAANQAFKSRHTFLRCMQGNGTQSTAYVNVKLAAIISPNIRDIFLSVTHTRKQKPFLITQK